MQGRPILGVISGFLFGLLLGVTLFLFGALPLDSVWLLILPVLGIALGLIMAAWAPFGSREPASAQPPPTGAGPSGTTLEQDAVPPLDEGGPSPSDGGGSPPSGGGDAS
jgi:hypothetical protein